MGDSILTSLSLPPSGRVATNQPTGPSRSLADEVDGTQTKDKSPFITPVIGLISNEDVPLMISASKQALRGKAPVSLKGATSVNFYSKQSLKFTSLKKRQKSKDDGGEESDEEEERNTLKRSNGVKRKKPEEKESASEEEDEVLGKSVKKRLSGSSQGANKSEKLGAEVTKDVECNEITLETRMKELGVRTLHLSTDPSVRSIYIACLNSKSKVVMEKLPITSASVNVSDVSRKSSNMQKQHQRRKSLVKAPSRKSNQPQKSDSDLSGLDDKE